MVRHNNCFASVWHAKKYVMFPTSVPRYVHAYTRFTVLRWFVPAVGAVKRLLLRVFMGI